MQASTWNQTNQHWIPRFLLKGFGIKRRASQVYTLDKQTNKITECDVNDVASKQGLLTERDDKLMGIIEVHCASVIDRIRKGNLNISPEQRQTIDTLVYAMMMNDPYNGIDIDAAREASVKDLTSEMTRALARSGGYTDHQYLNAYVNGSLNHDHLNILMDTKFSAVRTALALMGLSVYTPEAGEFFVIGDSPVMVVRSTVDGQRSLTNPGSQVILPIGSLCALVYSWETPINSIQHGGVIARDQVRSLGFDYYSHSSSRYIFGRHRAALEYARMSENRRDASARSTNVNDGWVKMQSEMRMGSIAYAKSKDDFKNNLDVIARDLVKRAQEDVR